MGDLQRVLQWRKNSGGKIQAERSLQRREIYDGFHFLALSYFLDKKKEKDEERQTAKAP